MNKIVMLIYENKDINGIQFGNEHGVLFLKHTNSDFSKFADLPLYGLLPMLEHNFKDLCSNLSITRKTLEDNFLLSELLKFPFDQKRNNWAADSLQWIIDSEKSTELHLWSKTIDRNWMGQKLMHRFNRVFPNYELPLRK